MRSVAAGILCLVVSLPLITLGQRPVDSTGISPGLSAKYISSIGERSASINTKIDQSTQKYLQSL